MRVKVKTMTGKGVIEEGVIAETIERRETAIEIRNKVGEGRDRGPEIAK